jgi:hypothetical protein
VTDQPQAPRPGPTFSTRDATALYLQGQSDALSESFLTVLRHFRDTSYGTLLEPGRRFIDEFVETFLTLFTKADYLPNETHQSQFVRLNATLSNLVALSRFKTTDAHLSTLGTGADDFGKRLTLCSARNATAIDRASFFDVDPALACLWYSAYAELYRGALLDSVVWKNLKEHFAFEDDRLDARRLPMIAYFASTYVGEFRDRNVRSIINRSWKTVAEPLQQQVRNRPDPRKIAVLSGGWSPAHSAYRITKAFVEALQGYHLTFVPLGTRKGLDLSLFQEVKTLEVDRNGLLDIRALLDNDFMVAYYPDVGLSPQSVLLANLRIAPIQVASLGHSVSTWGAEIDYFFSGAQVEPPENPERNYSERLVLLPGFGAVHERPDYEPRAHPPPRPELILNFPWNAQKVNYPLGLTLQELIRRSQRPLHLRLFTSGSLNRQNDYLPFVRDLQSLLGPDSVEVLRDLPYRDYMARMEEGDFTLDSYPFGGCNVVMDSLFLRRLIVCREGDLWYNRIGPAMLRSVGLSELIATSEEEYLRITLRLIHDEAHRADLQDRLDRADLDATILDRSDARAFRKAIDILIADRENLSGNNDRSPIRIDV